MKTSRIINAIFWIVMATVIVTMSVIEWAKQGCGTTALLLMVGMYTSICATLYGVIDAALQGK